MEKLLSFLIIIKQKNYPPIDLVPWATPTIPIFDQNYHPFNYRQSSAGTKIISDALLSANYCFMDDENLKDLKKLLSQDQINLSNIIVSTNRKYK